jgi:hypothetical protein
MYPPVIYLKRIFFIHFILLASMSFASEPISKVSGPKVYTKKYSQLFIKRFYTWYSENLSVPSVQLNTILEQQQDFMVKVDNTYINTFQIGYVESPSYTGSVLRVLGASAKSLIKQKPPVLDNIIYEGCEIKSGTPAKIDYLAVVKNKNSEFLLRRYEQQNSEWKLAESVTLNTIPTTALTHELAQNYYQADSDGSVHTTGLIKEKYLSLGAQKIINHVRRNFNIDPSLVTYTDSRNFKFYYP